jgi:hypothetical protein
MNSPKGQGPVASALRRLGRTLKRAILGKSTFEYLSEIAGGDEYWDRIIAAEQGWPQAKSSLEKGASRRPDSGLEESDKVT